MKFPALISALLCMALYAVQIVVPCNCCFVDSPTPSSLLSGCSGCANHDAPDEKPTECSCDMELPTVSWDKGKSEEKGELKMPTMQKDSEPFHALPLQRKIVTTIALPPPVPVNAQVMYCLFLI